MKMSSKSRLWSSGSSPRSASHQTVSLLLFNCPTYFRIFCLQVKVRHDNKGGGAAWFLDYILVLDPKANREYFFPCQRWLATDKSDGLISRELFAVDKTLMDKLGNKSTAIKDEILLEHKGRLCGAPSSEHSPLIGKPTITKDDCSLVAGRGQKFVM